MTTAHVAAAERISARVGMQGQPCGWPAASAISALLPKRTQDLFGHGIRRSCVALPGAAALRLWRRAPRAPRGGKTCSTQRNRAGSCGAGENYHTQRKFLCVPPALAMQPDRTQRNYTRLRGTQRNYSNARWVKLFARGDSSELGRKGGRDKAKEGGEEKEEEGEKESKESTEGSQDARKRN